MNSTVNKAILIAFITIILAACTPAVTPTATLPAPTITETSSPTTIPTLIPTITPTVTASATPPPTSTPTKTPSPTPIPTPTQTASATPAPSSSLQRVAAIEDLLPGAFQDLQVGPDGAVWLMTKQGVAQWKDGSWNTVLADFAGTLVGVDAAKRVWVVAEDASQISAWDGLTWTHYAADDGWLPISDDWLRVSEGPSDHSGHFWLATSQDLRVFDGVSWTVFTPEEMGMGEMVVEHLLPVYVIKVVSSGQVWVAECEWGGPGPFGGRGVRWFDGQNWMGADSPVASGCATAIEEDQAGQVWVSVDENLWRYNPISGEWTQFPPPELPADEGRRIRFAASLTVDPSGDPWVMYVLCGGASCYGEMVHYHWHGEAWIRIGDEIDFPFFPPPDKLIFGPGGIPWLLWGGEIHNIVQDTLQLVVSAGLVWEIELDADGRLWLVAWHQGQDVLWRLDTRVEH